MTLCIYMIVISLSHFIIKNMAKQIGWSQESNLLYQISALITRLTQVTAANSGGGGVTSFNTRVGDISLLSSDVTGALGYTPVPYTGATGAVNLGAYNLTVNGLTVGKGNNSLAGNTALGEINLSSITSGNFNTAIGRNSMYQVTTGSNNTALGNAALLVNVTGSGNTAIGMQSLWSTTGSNNVALGLYAGRQLTSGTYNILVGINATLGLTTGNYNTIIGSQITGLTAALANNIILADGQGNIKYRWDGTTNTITGDLAVTGVLRPTVTTNRQTASYTLVLTDRGKLVEMNVATANNLTIPLDSAVAFPIGTQLEIAQYGAGQTTIVATGGVTIRSASGNLKIASQYVAISLIKIGTNEWYCFGNLSA